MGLVSMNDYLITNLIEEHDKKIILSSFEAMDNLKWFKSEVEELLQIFSGIDKLKSSIDNENDKLIFYIEDKEVIICSKSVTAIKIELLIPVLNSLISDKELKLLIDDVIDFFCMVISEHSKPLANKTMELFLLKKVKNWDKSIKGFEINSWFENDYFVVFIFKV